MKHLLKLEDWTTEEIMHCLNLADQLKYEQKHGIEHKHLKGKTLLKNRAHVHAFPLR